MSEEDGCPSPGGGPLRNGARVSRQAGGEIDKWEGGTLRLSFTRRAQ